MMRSRLQALPTTRARFSRKTGSAEAKIDRLDPAHPFAPARRRRQVLEFRVELAVGFRVRAIAQSP